MIPHAVPTSPAEIVSDGRHAVKGKLAALVLRTLDSAQLAAERAAYQAGKKLSVVPLATGEMLRFLQVHAVANSQSPENAAVYHRGLVSTDELTPPERMHFITILLGIFSASEAMFWNQRNGLLQDEIWDREVKVLRFYLQRPGGRAMWRGTRTLFSTSFSQFVDSELERLESSTTPAA